MALTSEKIEILQEVLEEAKEAIQFVEVSLKEGKVPNPPHAATTKPNQTVSRLYHISPQTIAFIESMQSKPLALVPDIVDILRKLAEEAVLMTLLNKDNLRNNGIRKHIVGLLTITKRLSLLVMTEIEKNVAGYSPPSGPTTA